MGLRSAFRRFVVVQDKEAALAAASVGGWLGVTAFVILLVISTAFLPGVSGFFELRWRDALLAYGLVFLVISSFHVVIRVDGDIKDRGWALYILGNSTTQFFAACLASLSSPRGAPVFATLFLFAAAYHAHLHRSGPREPFMGIGTALAAVGAWAVAPTPANTSLFVVVGPTAVVVSLLSGYYAQRALHMKIETGKLRSAIQAQILSDRDQELEAVRHELVEVLAASHDVNNALTALVLDADTVVAYSEMEGAKETSLIASDLAESLRRVLRLRSAMHPATESHKARTVPEPVELAPVVGEVLKAATSRHPKVRLALGSEPADMAARVVGGATSLRRILENLVVNACEGDGVRAAQTVRLLVAPDATGTAVRIGVIDDGPGFPPELLDRSVEGFKTTKVNGTGLGLYTVSKLIAASGGTLSRTNVDGGGARVDVLLPLAERVGQETSAA